MLMMLILACSGDDGSTSVDPTGDTAAVVYEPTWEGMQQLFEDHCDSCHPATNSIDLRANINDYVVPGDPQASDLWISVSGQSLSTMMPPSGRLPQETISPVEAWILAGAPQ